MKNQLPLTFQHTEPESFDNFFVGNNQQLIHSLHDQTEQLIFIWGEPGAGKSHLLQATCEDYLVQQKSALYIPLQQDDELTPDCLEGLEMMDLVCLDQLDSIIQDNDWETALFHFFNRIWESECRLIVAAENSAHNLAIQLPDLKSRLTWGLTYQVQSLDDDQKIEMLKLRAHHRGFDMSDEVASFLMKRSSREVSQLITLLKKLDYASMVEQRKLTIPFIKQFL